MKKQCFRLLFLLAPLLFCAAQAGEGIGGRLSSISSSLSAAHISLAPGTRVRVTNLETGRSIVVIVSRRLSADSGHIVELAVPAAEVIGLRNEARVRVEPINSDGTPPPVSAGESARESPIVRDGPLAEAGPGEQRPLPAIRLARPPDRIAGGPEAGTEPGPRNFYYTNSYEGEYPGSIGEGGPPPSQESRLSSAGIVTLPPETDRPAAPPSAPPARPRPVPPPSASLAQALPAPPPEEPALSRPAPPPPEEPPPARPVLPPPEEPVRPRPAVPAPGSGTSSRAAAPAPERGPASAQIALPADTDRVVLSMNRDESGKLWVYVESEAAREVAVTEIPRPAPIQAPAPARQQTAPPRQAVPPQQAPPPQAQAPVPAPPPRQQTPVRPPQAQAPVPAPPPRAQAPAPAPLHRQITVTVVPRLPPAGDGKRYILQAGSYRERAMAEALLFNLQNLGIAAAMESRDASIRVVINGVYAEDIPALAEKLGQAGVTEIWVRER